LTSFVTGWKKNGFSVENIILAKIVVASKNWFYSQQLAKIIVIQWKLFITS